MAAYTASELVDSGKYRLRIEEPIDLQEGDDFEYRVVKGGYVQPDKTVPLTIEVVAPPRLAGRVYQARLVPVEEASPQSLLDLFSHLPAAEA